MLTATELEYCKMYLTKARDEGYKYYVVQTVTESGSDYDVCIYLSRDKIVCSSPTTFSISDSKKVLLDSSSGTYNGSGSRFSIGTFSGVLSVNKWEFCYTNAELQGGTLLPDINDLGGNANVNFQAVGLLVACVFCLLIGFRIFR